MLEVQSLAESLYERLKTGDLNVEERRLDIKKQWYHKQSSKSNKEVLEEFCKDICALANSCYPSSGYLLFGLATAAPFVFEAPIPQDEASLQQQLGSGISPVPDVQFSNFHVAGIRISAATISPSAKGLPYVAKYKDNLWIPWIRQGTSTRSASHLDLVSMFDLRKGAEHQAVPQLSVARRLEWASNWGLRNVHWSPFDDAPISGELVSGLHTTLQIRNAGLLPTALVALSAKLEFSNGEIVISDSCGLAEGWPIPMPERAGGDLTVTFYFKACNIDNLSDVVSLEIVGTDLDDKSHVLDIEAPQILQLG
jgi:hypothetical protein